MLVTILKMNVNPGILVEFEGNEFRHCADVGGDISFDTWVLKSPGKILKFEKEGYVAFIETIKFPNGFFGYGFGGTALNNSQQCYCHGVIGHKTFKNEFEAQCAAINYVLKNELLSGWNHHFIRLKMNDFINPKTLF